MNRLHLLVARCFAVALAARGEATTDATGDPDRWPYRVTLDRNPFELTVAATEASTFSEVSDANRAPLSVEMQAA